MVIISMQKNSQKTKQNKSRNPVLQKNDFVAYLLSVAVQRPSSDTQ